ncbi:alpha-beta hydrolase superfamily lysophospholipase [Pullulanibacillus pueri]|nr:alpha-beta hydrolase superfamily lysophospholipase [Pullulanibacillus pueri]
MAEHAGRYQMFAEALCAQGFALYANDHRGHGRTARSPEERVHLDDENGWEKTVEDMKRLSDYIQLHHHEVPLFLFGHSMGSFLVRRFIQKYCEGLAGVILSGTGADPGLASTIGIKIAERARRKYGSRARSEKLNQLIIGRYNKSFKQKRTASDWLSRDQEEVERYINDPYCGQTPTIGFFIDLMTGLKALDKKANLKQVPMDLPVLFISGAQDPVGGAKKGVIKTYHHFKKAGLQKLELKFYEGARHELLNETNREEVTRDIIQWLNDKISHLN